VVVLRAGRPTALGRALLALALGATAVTGCGWFDDDPVDGAGEATGADVEGEGPASEPEGPEPADELPPAVDGWERTTPADAGLDASVIDEVADHAERIDSDCFAVVRDGKLVDLRTWGGADERTPTPVFSITKSIASTLVGIAQADGLLDIDDPVARYVPEWAGGEHAAVTIRDVLSNTSGLQRNVNSDYFGLAEERDRTSFALGRPQQAPPGTLWAYNNTAIQVLDAVMVAVTGVPTREFAEERLFGPLGMDDTDLEPDQAGNTTLPFGASSTCLDLARLGMLVLDEGRWDGEPLVPASWIADATSPSSELNEAYGLLWWLNVEGRVLSTALATSTAGDERPTIGQQVPGAPEDLVWALGLGDQILQIHPGTGTVVVRIGNPQDLGAEDRFTEVDTARIVTEGVTS
jgi:CubicO group peptidase (beta-lactamase class C family)